MALSWHFETGRLTCSWPDIGQYVQYNPPWMQEISEPPERLPASTSRFRKPQSLRRSLLVSSKSRRPRLRVPPPWYAPIEQAQNRSHRGSLTWERLCEGCTCRCAATSLYSAALSLSREGA